MPTLRDETMLVNQLQLSWWHFSSVHLVNNSLTFLALLQNPTYQQNNL